MFHTKTTLILFILGSCLAAGWGEILPEPPGRHLPRDASDVADLDSFGPGDRVSAVYYFYWYRHQDACISSVCDPLYTRSHIEFATGAFGAAQPVSALTHTPTDLESIDFADPDWHRREIERISSASIEIILPVFWGVPGRYDDSGHYNALWSRVGMESLVTALETLEAEGRSIPKVGMFYDTTTLTFESPFHPNGQGKKIDLTTSEGKNHFYATIRDFYSLLPPKYWALWEGRPLVWLYAAEYASRFDETLLPETRSRFADECFGLSPWFVAHLDWLGAGAEWEYRWGGAVQPSFLSVNSIGPGFDNSGAFGEKKGSRVVRDRGEGRFYRDAWEHALRSPAAITVIETWNELHEGTEIRPTVEDGEEYLDLTREYARQLGADVPPLPGPFAGNASVAWSPVPPSAGLDLVAPEDGGYRLTESEEEVLIEMQDPYLYFAVDDSFHFASESDLEVEVTFYDLPDRFGKIYVEYDSFDREATHHGIYKSSEEIPLAGTFQWRTEKVSIPRARLANNQNAGADFRIVGPRGIRIRGVALHRGGPAEPAQP